MNNLITQYQEILKTQGDPNEAYKWHAINHFQEHWDIGASDFARMFLNAFKKKGNLMYQNSWGYIKKAVTNFPDEVREIFRGLYDESIHLQQRMETFQEKAEALLPKVKQATGKKKLKAQQDERTLSVYLAFRFPEKYYLYKSSYYANLCAQLEVPEADTGDRYLHFMELAEELKQRYIANNPELQQIHQRIYPDSSWKQDNLILQNFLYKMLEKPFLGNKNNDAVEKPNFWIFQGSPEIYDIQNALKAGHLKSWKVSAHKEKIKKGDKVILWETGNNAGCYALAEIDSEVDNFREEPFEKPYYKGLYEDKNDLRVKLKVTDYAADDPVLWEKVKGAPELKAFKAGNQGTNFSATIEEFSFFKNKIMAKKEGNVKKEFINWLIVNPKSDYFGNDFDTLDRYLKTYNSYFDIDLFKCSVENYKDIIDLIDKEVYRDENSEFFKYSERESNHRPRAILGRRNYFKFLNEKFSGQITVSEIKNEVYAVAIPLNQILYGPPGTGKTFKLKNEYFPKYTIKEASISKEAYFEETVRDLTWWQAIALALLEQGTSKVNELLTNRWVAAKAKLSESKNVRAALWGNLQMHTIHESTTVAYTQRQVPLIFDKNENKAWELLDTDLKEQFPELYDILESVNNFKPNPQKEIRHFVFTTFHQSFAYEDFVEGIKPNLNNDGGTSELSYQIENGIFKDLCLRAQSDPDNNYAIFIDEINRGNVSAIFGELITLIEPDKRLGATNEIKVRLPYSKTEFGVPKNIDIIATMNTADRSVEALDTALRRRFSFKEVMPQPSLLKDIQFEGFNLKEVLETINQRIAFLLDRDHTIGHSYFLDISSGDQKALKRVFKNKVIPLLQEYFYHDYEKIALILGPGFVTVKTNHQVAFPNIEGIDRPDQITHCELIRQIDDIEKAVLKLLNRNGE
jgi:hypothetical protein